MGAPGGDTNSYTEVPDNQVIVWEISVFSVTLLKHFCQSVSFYVPLYGRISCLMIVPQAKNLTRDIIRW